MLRKTLGSLGWESGSKTQPIAVAMSRGLSGQDAQERLEEVSVAMFET